MTESFEIKFPNGSITKVIVCNDYVKKVFGVKHINCSCNLYHAKVSTYI